MAKKAGAAEVLRVKGLTRSFGELHVLREVNVSLRTGQICAVTGPNGAGKTTLLRCVAGTIKPDAGEVLILGQAVDESDPHTRAAVASVLDDVDFFPDLSVVEHLELMAYTHAHPGPGERGGGDADRAQPRRRARPGAADALQRAAAPARAGLLLRPAPPAAGARRAGAAPRRRRARVARGPAAPGEAGRRGGADGLPRRGAGRRGGRRPAGHRRMTSDQSRGHGDEAGEEDLADVLADVEHEEAAGVAPRIPAVTELRRALRRTRRAHSDRTLGELLTDVYLLAFIVVLYGGGRRVQPAPPPVAAAARAGRHRVVPGAGWWSRCWWR